MDKMVSFEICLNKGKIQKKNQLQEYGHFISKCCLLMKIVEHFFMDCRHIYVCHDGAADRLSEWSYKKGTCLFIGRLWATSLFFMYKSKEILLSYILAG